MSGLEIFEKVAYGQVVFRRDGDAWDLLKADGDVVAVLCPRSDYLSISPVGNGAAAPRAKVGRRIPYGERVAWNIRGDEIDAGKDVVADLVLRRRSRA